MKSLSMLPTLVTACICLQIFQKLFNLVKMVILATLMLRDNKPGEIQKHSNRMGKISTFLEKKIIKYINMPKQETYSILEVHT